MKDEIKSFRGPSLECVTATYEEMVDAIYRCGVEDPIVGVSWILYFTFQLLLCYRQTCAILHTAYCAVGHNRKLAIS